MSGDTHTPPNPHTLSPEMREMALGLWGQAGEAHYLSITGGSMRPTLMSGDQVLIAPTKDVEVGDLIVFRRGDELINT